MWPSLFRGSCPAWVLLFIFGFVESLNSSFKCQYKYNIKLFSFQACWEPAETFGWENPIQIRCPPPPQPPPKHPPTLTLPTLTCNPLPYAKLSPLLPNKLSPSSHSTSAPRRSEPLPTCPKYFAPRCFPVCSRTSPSPFLSNSLTSAVAAAQKKAALVHSLLWFSPSAKDGVARPVSWERRQLIVCRHGFCPPASCAVIGLALL